MATFVRSFDARQYQTYDVDLPDNWEDMDELDRDHFICDNGQLVSEHSEAKDDWNLELDEE